MSETKSRRELDSTNIKKWTEEERLALASKLDTELDDYINSLERKPYTDGWDESNWQEEMSKHPFFMTEAPGPNDKLSPLMEGLQQLKYSEEDNTPEELAKNYKEDGNFNYKYKKYRLAILSYTEGIKTKCEDKELMAQLYNNRSATHFAIQNYRSSLNDCKEALKFNPTYYKAMNRAANCCMKIKDYEQCVEWCVKYLDIHPTDKVILKLKTEATIELKRALRDERKKLKAQKYLLEEEVKLFSAFEKRNIKIEPINGSDDLSLENLEPKFPQIAQCRVHLDEYDSLVWPVMILYPEMQQTDFIQNFHEDILMADQLKDLFEPSPEWDQDHRYTLGNINVYYENKNGVSICKVNFKNSLKSILQDGSCVVRGGTPVFSILVKNSAAEKQFLSNYNYEE